MNWKRKPQELSSVKTLSVVIECSLQDRGAAQPVELAPLTGPPAARIIQGQGDCEIFGNLEEEKSLCTIKIFFLPPAHIIPPGFPTQTNILPKVLKMTQLSQVRNVLIFLLESVNYEIHIKGLKHF